MDAKLVVVGGKANKSEVKLKLPTVVGRGRDADLTVAHGTVSRHHCLIYELDGALVVRDNGSLNGTLVEGQRIKEALLRPGDTLTVGPLTFRADYEHQGSFPTLGEQPTIPNFQDTVGAAAGANGAPAVVEPPAGAEDNLGQFDFLRQASLPAETENEAEEDVDVPDFGEPAAAASAATEEPAIADEEPPLATSGEPTLDFLAGGSDVAPVVDDEVAGFDFLGRSESPAAQADDDAPQLELAEPAATEKEYSEAIADSASSFGFIEQGQPAAEEPEPEWNFDGAAAEAEPAAIGEAEIEDEAIGGASEFDFLSQAPAEPEEAAPEWSLEEAAAPRQAPLAEPAAEQESELAIEAPSGEEAQQDAGAFDFLGATAASAEPPAEEQAAEEQALAAGGGEPGEEPTAFDFLNQAQAEPEEAAPEWSVDETASSPESALAESEAEAEPELAPEAPSAPETPSAFDFLGATAASAEPPAEAPLEVSSDGGPQLEASEPAAVEEELTAGAPSFSFLPPDGAGAEAPASAPAELEAADAVGDEPALEIAAPTAEEPGETAATEEEHEFPQFDLSDHSPAVGAGEDAAIDAPTPAADDDSPNFGFLGNLAPSAGADEPDASLPELTLHDPEESEDEVADLAGAADLLEESSLQFESDAAAPASDSAGGFDFLGAAEESAPSSDGAAGFRLFDSQEEAATVEPELKPFSSSVDEDASSGPEASQPEALEFEDPESAPSLKLSAEEIPLAESDDDSGEFALPFEAPAAEASEALSFNFLGGAEPPAAPEEAAVADDEGEEYALLQTPDAPLPQASFPIVEEAAAAEDDEPAPVLEAMAAAGDESAAKPASEPDAEPPAKPKRGWWPFGKSKGAASSAAKGKAVDQPTMKQETPAQSPALPLALSAASPAVNDDAAFNFVADVPAARAEDSSASLSKTAGANGQQAAGFQIETDEKDESRKPQASGRDDELNNFFESIGLD